MLKCQKFSQPAGGYPPPNPPPGTLPPGLNPLGVDTYGGGMPCPVSAAWHSCVAAHWSEYSCYKQAPSQYDLRCLKATLNPNIIANKLIGKSQPFKNIKIYQSLIGK